MPSRQSQRIRILNLKDKSSGKNYYIMIGLKTGYRNVWIGDRHFYYNYAEQYQMGEKIDIDKIILQRKKKQESQRKQTILITKKGG